MAAEAAFRARLQELGATMIGPYVNSKTPVLVRCAAGHERTPRPSDVARGHGICWTCSLMPGARRRRRDSVAAENWFHDRIAELGATIEGEYVDTQTLVLLCCASGHLCKQRPSTVRRGIGICRTCAGQDPAVARTEFLERLATIGATLLETEWLGSGTPHRVICAAGHQCKPRPSHLQRGLGICGICARNDKAAAERRFREKLAELGAAMLGDYVNNATPVLIRCAEGHQRPTRPGHVLQGRGPCLTCAGKDPAAAEAAFRATMAELGAAILGDYVNGKTPILVRCPEGHRVSPRPNAVLCGGGICRKCRGKTWDVFYVVASDTAVKFGITSGNPRPRLRTHARSGYATVVRLVTNLPGTAAPDTENAVKAALRDAGEKPVKRREYFDLDCLALILDVADAWLAGEGRAAA